MIRSTLTVAVRGLLLLALIPFCECVTPAEIEAEAERIVDIERKMQFGASLRLSAEEMKVSNLLVSLKENEIRNARLHGSVFPPAVSFFQTKKLIEQSQVFQIIKRMPKGGILHIHDFGIVNLDWVIKNVTYRPNCYMCYDSQNQLQMHFFDIPPRDNDCQWQTVEYLRKTSRDSTKFDQRLYDEISIVVDDPGNDYVTVNDVWKKFEHYFDVVFGLCLYEPVFKDYILNALKEVQADNVQYLEVRLALSPVYQLDGSQYDEEYAVKTYESLTRQFVQDNPSFIGCRIIVVDHKALFRTSIRPSLEQAILLNKKYPDTVSGYDLVGQEGKLNPLPFYLNDLLIPSQQCPPRNLPYYFHAGETDWEGTDVDENLVYAVLLNSSRIGHGYALYKHPEVMKMVKEKDIAVEVNPISNQVLVLTNDLRNHGAVTLFAENFPLVVSSDDPAVWDALPMSHDFYMAYMAMTRADAGLEVLKQLAINSIKYSALPAGEKRHAMKKWKKKWKSFIRKISRSL